MKTLSGAVDSSDRTPSVGKLPVLVGSCIWTNLPYLLAIDLILAVTALPTIVVLLSGGSLIAAVVAGLSLGPVWAAVVATTDRIVGGDDVWLLDLRQELRRHWSQGLKLGASGGAIISVGLATLVIWQGNPDRTWLLVPLFMDGSATALMGIAGLSVFSLATTGRLRGWDLWLTALQLATRRPVLTVGTVALFSLLWLLVTRLPGIAVVLPGLCALYLSALVDTMTAPEPGVEETPNDTS